MLRELGEELKLCRRQLDSRVATRDAHARRVERHVSDVQDVAGGCCRRAAKDPGDFRDPRREERVRENGARDHPVLRSVLGLDDARIADFQGQAARIARVRFGGIHEPNSDHVHRATPEPGSAHWPGTL